MRVGEVLSGVPPGQTEVEIVTGLGGGDCGYAFQSGVDYFVYARKDGRGRLTTNICSRTRPLDQAEEDLAYFRKIAAAPFANELRVLTGLPGAPGEPGVTIRAEGTAGRYFSQTDAAGVAAFAGLQPGKYSIHLESDGALPTDPTIQVNAKGCVDVKLLRIPQLVGQVTTDDGRPAAGIAVEVVSPKGLEDSARTSADGRYRLSVWRPGPYKLGVNLTHTATQETPYPRWFYPGTEDPSAAATIESVGRPEHRVFDFVLPAQLKERRIEGIVRMTDGRPAPVVLVRVLDGSNTFVAQGTADRDGHFALRVFEGVSYELHAVWPGAVRTGATSAVPEAIPAGSGPLSLHLVLDQAGNSVVDAMQKADATRQ